MVVLPVCSCLSGQLGIRGSLVPCHRFGDIRLLPAVARCDTVMVRFPLQCGLLGIARTLSTHCTSHLIVGSPLPS